MPGPKWAIAVANAAIRYWEQGSHKDSWQNLNAPTHIKLLLLEPRNFVFSKSSKICRSIVDILTIFWSSFNIRGNGIYATLLMWVACLWAHQTLDFWYGCISDETERFLNESERYSVFVKYNEPLQSSCSAAAYPWSLPLTQRLIPTFVTMTLDIWSFLCISNPAGTFQDLVPIDDDNGIIVETFLLLQKKYE